MITSLGIALREGIEAALVVGIVLLFLKRTGRPNLKRHVYAAVGIAVLVSVALAVILDVVGLDAENPYLEGALLAVAGVFVIAMVVWMMRTARGLKAGMEGKLEALTTTRTGRALGWGLFGFVFFTEVPGVPFWIGGGLIVGACVVAMRVAGAKPATPAVDVGAVESK